jgi:hypothetical protein
MLECIFVHATPERSCENVGGRSLVLHLPFLFRTPAGQMLDSRFRSTLSLRADSPAPSCREETRTGNPLPAENRSRVDAKWPARILVSLTRESRNVGRRPYRQFVQLDLPLK